MESGNAVGPPYNDTTWHQPMYDRLVARANCSDAADTLDCLREMPFEQIYAVAYEGLEWFAVVDGEFIPRYPQVSYLAGKIAKVPILLGTNTDEGTSFGTTGIDTDEEYVEALMCTSPPLTLSRLTGFVASKRWNLNRTQATSLLNYYPDNPAAGCPYGWGNTTWPDLGLMYKRYSSMAGDITMVGPRRLLAQTMSGFEQAVYSYRWDVPAMNESSRIGVQHFAEVDSLQLEIQLAEEMAGPVRILEPRAADYAAGDGSSEAGVGALSGDDVGFFCDVFGSE